jgi:hypothetical protein
MRIISTRTVRTIHQESRIRIGIATSRSCTRIRITRTSITATGMTEAVSVRYKTILAAAR